VRVEFGSLLDERRESEERRFISSSSCEGKGRERREKQRGRRRYSQAAGKEHQTGTQASKASSSASHSSPVSDSQVHFLLQVLRTQGRREEARSVQDGDVEHLLLLLEREVSFLLLLLRRSTLRRPWSTMNR